MKMFVTGATGLLGSNLVRALRAEGHSVRALVRSKEKAQRQLGDSGVELVVGDMENVPGFGGALEGVDVLFHTAAYFREYYGAGNHWPKLEAINVRGTLALAEAARAHRVRRMIDTSSSGTIGLKPDGSPGDEDTPPAPVAKGNLYFKSKVLVAGQLQALAARTGLDVVQILPGWMFGPGDAAPSASGRLVLDFLAGKLPAVPPLADVIQTLEQVTGQSGPRARIPYPVAFVYAAISQTWAKLTGAATLVTLQGVRGLQARLAVTSAKAEQELGWKHRPLRETLADEVAWYRARGLAAEPAAPAAAVAA